MVTIYCHDQKIALQQERDEAIPTSIWRLPLPDQLTRFAIKGGDSAIESTKDEIIHIHGMIGFRADGRDNRIDLQKN